MCQCHGAYVDDTISIIDHYPISLPTLSHRLVLPTPALTLIHLIQISFVLMYVRQCVRCPRRRGCGRIMMAYAPSTRVRPTMGDTRPYYTLHAGVYPTTSHLPIFLSSAILSFCLSVVPSCPIPSHLVPPNPTKRSRSRPGIGTNPSRPPPPKKTWRPVASALRYDTGTVPCGTRPHSEATGHDWTRLGIARARGDPSGSVRACTRVRADGAKKGVLPVAGISTVCHLHLCVGSASRDGVGPGQMDHAHVASTSTHGYASVSRAADL